MKKFWHLSSESMATTSLPNARCRLPASLAGTASVLICSFKLTRKSSRSSSAAVSTTFTSACTLALKNTGGSGWAPMLGRYNLPRHSSAERNWLGNTPCGSLAIFGSAGIGYVGIRAERIVRCVVSAGFLAISRTIRVKTGIWYWRQRHLVDLSRDCSPKSF